MLVIGGTGFIGGRLVERLLIEEGADVRVMVREWHKAVWVSRTTADLVAGDVLDYGSLRRAVEGCAIVFDCASGPSAEGGYQRTNVEGSRNVIRACRESGVRRCVYVSTIAVHGNDPPEKLGPSSPLVETGRDYSDSKVLAEKLFSEAYARDQFPVVTIRPTYVWGPRSALFTVRQLCEMKKGRFCFVDQGRARSHAVYIDNLVDALILAGVQPQVCGKAFIITDDQLYTWTEFFGHYQRMAQVGEMRNLSSLSWRDRAGCRFLDRCQRVVEKLQGNSIPLPIKVIRRMVFVAGKLLARRYMSEWDMKKYARESLIDMEDARASLGYHPSWKLEEGMRETARWVEDQLPALKAAG